MYSGHVRGSTSESGAIASTETVVLLVRLLLQLAQLEEAGTVTTTWEVDGEVDRGGQELD